MVTLRTVFTGNNELSVAILIGFEPQFKELPIVFKSRNIAHANVLIRCSAFKNRINLFVQQQFPHIFMGYLWCTVPLSTNKKSSYPFNNSNRRFDLMRYEYTVCTTHSDILFSQQSAVITLPHACIHLNSFAINFVALKWGAIYKSEIKR